jgi:microcystin degradation protein MlrC
MPADSPKRIAILGFSLETNAFSPVCGEKEFRERGLFEGEEISVDARRPAPVINGGICGFYNVMDANGPWEPVPIVFAAAHPNGPAEKGFFGWLLETMRDGLAKAGTLDGVYCCEHGAGLAEENDDPDGEIFALARAAVGPDVPVIATLDLHANVSDRMVEATDVLVAYRTNPHVDAYERGQEAARCMLEMFDGVKPKAVKMRVPLVAPSVTLLTAEGYPYGDLIRLGQAKTDKDIMNVSIVAGFAWSDTDRNSMTTIVTARNDLAKAKALARELSIAAWADRERYQLRMTALDDATRMALEAGRDKNKPSLLFCDPADNPGGGGRGNTTYVLKAFVEAGVEDALFGVFNDAPLVAAAFKAGEGATITANFNSAETDQFSLPFTAEAVVEKLSDGQFVGTLGMVKGRTVQLGKACLLKLGGVRIIVISIRQQCLSNDYFKHFGLDAATARSTVVKSRGHFRAGFDHLFPPERILEIDVPGLTSPNLANFPWKNLPRPVYPMDPETTWTPPAA